MPLKKCFSFHFRIALSCLLLLICLSVKAQQPDSVKELSMDTVIIKAFEQNKKLRDVPAAINYINKHMLERFGTASVVAALNATPGVKMEERSPGSYRFNIRGSALRAPFGVRNVKVYFNDLPITDPGGTTYLNSLGYYDYNSVEIIKGPGSSLYGAGTGGVLLIQSMNEQVAPGITAGYTLGSYQLQNAYGAVTTGTVENKSRIAYQHQQSNGYRTQSKMRRDVFSWSGLFKIGANNILKTTVLYSDLFYQTPGALTLAEYNKEPKDARPTIGTTPGAVAAKAAIYQKTFFAGASYQQNISVKLLNKTILYGAYAKMLNPNIRNYSRNSEPHVGGRTVFTFKQPVKNSLLTINTGAEMQQGFATYGVYKNKAGRTDSVQTLDDVSNQQAFVFGNIVWDVRQWSLSAGASINKSKVVFERFAPAPLPVQKRNFNNQVAPRFSVLRKLKSFNIYSSIAKGFSPPAITELIPTGSAVNLNLHAEEGTSYDLGLRGNFFKTLYLDVAAFDYALRNTIVQRRDASGGDYYLNAGKTTQHGIESSLRLPLFKTKKNLQAQYWVSHTWHHFHYKDFKQLTSDFSGNRLPGVAPHTIASGLDVAWLQRFSLALTYFYSDRIPLNDANSAYAGAYHLVGAVWGFEKVVAKNIHLKTSVGVDNLLNQQYSLGDDINAFGGRYYNAAPRRNYFATFNFQWLAKKETL